MTDLPPYDDLSRFLELLGTRCQYAIVKNPDLWYNLQHGGDWDLLVSDLQEAQAVLLDALGPPRRVAERSYVVAHYYDWGEIDFLPHLTWQGIELIPAARFLARSVADRGGWPVACSAHQSIMGWIAPLLATGSFRPKYQSVVNHALSHDLDELVDGLHALFGNALGGRLYEIARAGEIGRSAKWLTTMRAVARRRAYAHHPASTLARALAFAYREGQLRSRPCLPFLRFHSADDALAAGRWCSTHRNAIPGLAVFDGVRLTKWPSSQSGIDNLRSYTPRRCQVDRPLTLSERVGLANLQAGGWLVGSMVPVRGTRASATTLIGRPRGSVYFAQNLEGFLESYLARETAHTLSLRR